MLRIDKKKSEKNYWIEIQDSDPDHLENKSNPLLSRCLSSQKLYENLSTVFE